jgi:hypothetical protein
MSIENELDAYIGGFHLNALSSGLPLNVDLDTTLTVIAGNLHRLLARQLPRYENATPRRRAGHERAAARDYRAPPRVPGPRKRRSRNGSRS